MPLFHLAAWNSELRTQNSELPLGPRDGKSHTLEMEQRADNEATELRAK